VEAVQRRFTKRLPGMQNLTYLARLKKLNLESLEIRRVRADLILMYKIMFCLIDVSVSDFFILNVSRNNRAMRAHGYQVMQPVNISASRTAFFSNRTINAWNSLPSTTNFSSLSLFRKSVNNTYLVKFCKVNFI